MKKSKYNHFLSRGDGKVIAYNSWTGGLALMDENKYRDYCGLVSVPEKIDALSLKEEYRDFVSKLKLGHFLVEDQVDELSELEMKNRLDRFDTTRLGLIIAPTLACNFKCEYCFEEVKKGSMSTETIDALVGFLEEKAKSLKTLSVSWYGGEPLVRFDLLEELSLAFRDICAEYKIAYGAGMMTNGYLLTKEMALKLRNLGVSSIQISVDGPKQIHDKRRPLANGQGSYEVILKNMIETKDILDLNLRVNVDKTTRKEDIAELLTDLVNNNLQEKVNLFFGNVEAANDVCVNIAENCYDNKEFSKMEYALHNLALDFGFRLEKLPSPIASYCSAQSINSFLVDPQGFLYKCFNDVGISERSCGHIKDPVDPFHPNLFPFLNWNPFKNQTCQDCSILPLCMGGCPHRIIWRKEKLEDNCESWKYNLNEMLEMICQSRLRQRKKS